MLEVRHYLNEKGEPLFTHWLENLKDRQARAKIKVRIDRLRLGNFGDCRSVGNGVSELKIDFGPGYRVYFGKDGENLVILLLGGNKKSQAKDIQNAKKYWNQYKETKND